MASLNSLVSPRLGDWAVVKVGARGPASTADPPAEDVVRTVSFDERWLLP